MPAKKRRRRRKGSRYHRGLHVSPKGGECKYRSGWELSYFQYLDSDPQVLSYTYEGLKIPYVSNAKTKRLRNYIPDILVTYVDGHRELVEIKQARKVHTPPVAKKLLAAGDWCRSHDVTLKIITEHELKELGLLGKKINGVSPDDKNKP